MISEKFIILGTLIALWASLGYIFETVKGRVKPNRVTFFLWALAPLVAFSAQIGKGVGPQAILTFMAGFGPLMIFIASFVNKKSAWKLGKFDFVCGGLSILGLIVWLLTSEGNIAIALSIGADGLAALPTFVKAYKAPQTEQAFFWFLYIISASITLLTIDNWTFANYGFVFYVLLVCTIMTVLVKFELGKKISAKLART